MGRRGWNIKCKRPWKMQRKPEVANYGEDDWFYSCKGCLWAIYRYLVQLIGILEEKWNMKWKLMLYGDMYGLGRYRVISLAVIKEPLNKGMDSSSIF